MGGVSILVSMNSKLTGEGAAADDDDDDVKKNHCNFRLYKQRLLSIEMKTKLVQHVESD